MFETLVSSKIRRSLLEHILSHPDQRFYLRGIAKELTLPVSPVRRELKRLEHLGVLKVQQEANILFYLVDQTSPQFAQLKSAAGGSVEPEGGPSEPLVAATVISHPKIERIQRALRPAVSWPLVLGVTTLSVLAVAVVGLAVYLAMTNQRLLSLSGKAMTTPRTQVTVVEASPQASGEMRSGQWRLLPGAVGGFSTAGSTEESY